MENEIRNPIRYRRSRNWVIAVAVIVVGGWLLFSLTTEPLGPGSVTGLDGFTTVDAAGDTDEPIEGGWRLSYDDGSSGTFLVSLQNNGRFPVRVKDEQIFPRPGEFLALLVEDSVTFGSGLNEAGARSFADHHADLPAGEKLSVFVSAHFDSCDSYAEGTGNTFEHMTVRYRVLGIPRTAEIPLSMPLAVVSPAGCG